MFYAISDKQQDRKDMEKQTSLINMRSERDNAADPRGVRLGRTSMEYVSM